MPQNVPDAGAFIVRVRGYQPCRIIGQPRATPRETVLVEFEQLPNDPKPVRRWFPKKKVKGAEHL